MSETLTLVTVTHPVFGEATGALDAAGAWLALIPGKTSRREVTERLGELGFACVAGDASADAAATATFERWWQTGELPALRPVGTEFQTAVWAEIMKTPRGETRTYGALAKELPGAAPRPVGRAVGANKLGFFIPCHRIVATYGPGGYAWGHAMKERLLANEGVRLADLIRETEEEPGRPARHFPKPDATGDAKAKRGPKKKR